MRSRGMSRSPASHSLHTLLFGAAFSAAASVGCDVASMMMHAVSSPASREGQTIQQRDAWQAEQRRDQPTDCWADEPGGI